MHLRLVRQHCRLILKLHSLKFKFGGLVSKDVQSYVDSIIDADVVKMVTGELAVTNKPTTPAEEYGFTEEVGYTINNKSED